MLRVLVFGGRKYGETKTPRPTPAEITLARREREALWAELNALLVVNGSLVVIEGEASGADTLGKEWAEARGQKVEPYHAMWHDISHPDALIRTTTSGRKYDARAGHRRNQRMLDEGKPNHALEAPGGAGTADMRRRCLKAGITPKRITT